MKLELEVQDYMRSFEASFNSSQLTIALQLVFLLFNEKPNPTESKLRQALKKLEIGWRTPCHRVYEYASRPLFLHKHPKVKDLDRVDGLEAMKFFSECFRDPSQFTLVIAGDFDVHMTAKLVQKYLGSIPLKSCDYFPLERNGLKTFSIDFPANSVRRGIYRDEVDRVEVFICLPLKMDKDKQDEDEALLVQLIRIVRQRLGDLLRHKMGEVYSVSAEVLFDGKMYASPGSEEAILFVHFSYQEVSLDWILAEKALKEIEDLQINVSEEDIYCLPSSAETAQLVFLLFHKKPNPARRELMKALEGLNDERIPLSHQVYKFASGPSFLHKYPKLADLDYVDGAVAIKFFSESFLDPSQFTVVIAGDFDVDMTAKLVKKYLGSIPRDSSNIFPLDRCGLKTFPIDFPENSVRRGIYRDQAVVEVFICVPLKMDREKQDEDEYLIGILSSIVEQKLLNVLRNEMGEVYSLSTKAFFDGKMYASPGCEEAILFVNFVHKGTLDWKLVDKSLNVIEDLQINVSEADIACVLPSHAEAVEDKAKEFRCASSGVEWLSSKAVLRQ